MSLLINDARLSLCSLTRRLLPFIVSIKANCRALTLFSLGHLIVCEIELSLSGSLERKWNLWGSSWHAPLIWSFLPSRQQVSIAKHLIEGNNLFMGNRISMTHLADN
jgi:hypothetical protein